MGDMVVGVVSRGRRGASMVREIMKVGFAFRKSLVWKPGCMELVMGGWEMGN